MIYSSATNLLVIINDILDFSKIEAGKLKLERIEFDPCDVVDRVADMLALKANKKGLNFRSRIAANVPRTLRGDPGRLTQILINLTNNAVKFTNDGEVRIQVTLENQRKSWAVLRFEVTDTGVGIPADRLERIFGSFTQVDASTSGSPWASLRRDRGAIPAVPSASWWPMTTRKPCSRWKSSWPIWVTRESWSNRATQPRG